MKHTCDLHTHSVFSDGTYTPEELIDEAVSMGLSAIALCDHNTIDGLPDFIKAAKGKPIDAICGAEFSVDYVGIELHLLGLFLEEKYFNTISDLMNAYIARKEQSNIDLVAALARDGYILDYNKMKEKSPTGKINRAHIAAALTEAGYTESIKQAFQKLLAPEIGYYKEPKRITVWEMLTFLRSIHAVPVLAHPFLNLSESELLEFLPKAKECGLVGMETAYSTYDEATTALATSIAENFGLLHSGGSDFHGTNKPHIRLGVGTGDLYVPASWSVNLKATLQIP